MGRNPLFGYAFFLKQAPQVPHSTFINCRLNYPLDRVADQQAIVTQGRQEIPRQFYACFIAPTSNFWMCREHGVQESLHIVTPDVEITALPAYPNDVLHRIVHQRFLPRVVHEQERAEGGGIGLLACCGKIVQNPYRRIPLHEAIMNYADDQAACDARTLG